MFKLSAVAATAALIIAITPLRRLPEPRETEHGDISVGESGTNVVIVLHIAHTRGVLVQPRNRWADHADAGAARELEPHPRHRYRNKVEPQARETLVPDATGGVFAFPATMVVGNYDIVIITPAHAINSKGTGAVGRVMAAKPATITLHVSVGTKKHPSQQQHSSPGSAGERNQHAVAIEPQYPSLARAPVTCRPDDYSPCSAKLTGRLPNRRVGVGLKPYGLHLYCGKKMCFGLAEVPIVTSVSIERGRR